MTPQTTAAQRSTLPRLLLVSVDWKYPTKEQHILFTTTSSDYGKIVPTAKDLPKQRFTVTKKFSEHLSKSGPYRNCSLNTKQ
ncbi:hypothetical protein BCR44DRAFT_1495769 [Catenaria anguillulae PL171]|uniref:Uncharacterized protein n=1 Tax=Catenaria anguillulae PL171 TaxID=765915 RepID=A0A1Y2I0K5_9FUNG|nr:hypothetical protein BCR44DRAFT_1495769 [Catenaria anguillulae PL171]